MTFYKLSTVCLGSSVLYSYISKICLSNKPKNISKTKMTRAKLSNKKGGSITFKSYQELERYSKIESLRRTLIQDRKTITKIKIEPSFAVPNPMSPSEFIILPTKDSSSYLRFMDHVYNTVRPDLYMKNSPCIKVTRSGREY